MAAIATKSRRSPTVARLAVAISTAVPAITIATAHAAPDDLHRYRPVLRYDSAEEYFAQPVSLPPGTAEVRAGDRVYGHVATEGDDTWLQYWLFYAYNPQDRSPLKTGRHEGDWELVQFRIGADGRPVEGVMSEHSWAEGCGWTELEHSAGAAPVVYVANGSHAMYSEPGDHDRPFPDPTDEADGKGREVRPAVTEITDQRPSWVRYSGRWGDTEAGFIPGETSSPVGPRFQDSGAWDRPSSYADAVARPCRSGAPGRSWQIVVLIGLGVVLAVAVVWALRRRSMAATR